jgi:hypothetical protein
MTEQEAWARFAAIGLRHELGHCESARWSEDPKEREEQERLQDVATKECTETAGKIADAMLVQMQRRFSKKARTSR